MKSPAEVFSDAEDAKNGLLHRTGSRLAISPTLQSEHKLELVTFLQAQFAPWRLSDDASQLLPPLEATPQHYEREIEQLIANYLQPWGYRVDGEIQWDGEETRDAGILRVIANQIKLVPDEEEEPLSEEGMEQILGLLRSRNPDAIREGEHIMDCLNQPIPGVLEALLPHLNDPFMEVRWRAIECLTVLGEEAEPAVPALIAALKDPHEWVRSAAAATLGFFGSKAERAIPALEQLRHDPSYGPRGRAQEALESIRGSQTL